MELKIGDVVSLKSWNNECIKMTVNNPNNRNNKVSCIWFDKTGNVCRDQFKIESLIKLT